jgi:TolA-binding protein
VLNLIEAHMPRKSKVRLKHRVAPPFEPACFQNPVFKQCIQDIFAIFREHLVDRRIFVSGGCLSRTYLDSNMNEGHRLSFGDIDFKLPLCLAEELLSFLSHFNGQTLMDRDSSSCLPLVGAFYHLLQLDAKLKKAYCKDNRVVVNIEWQGVAVDFVLFEESLEQHALSLDVSVGAGFYNPALETIYFPCDELPEYDQHGRLVPCDRSAKDFMNKELNLVFPQQYWAVFDQDPIRILRIVQAVSRSDYTLSTVLRESITNYLYSRREAVFSEINPDRLYYNLKSLFFSGHAVKNLYTLMELNLLDVLFLNLSCLSPEEKKLIFHLIKCVATESDNNYLLSPSLLFYAVYWKTIKDKPYDQNMIFERSNGKIRLPISNNSLGKQEILDENLHNNNIRYLLTCEREYKNNQMCEQLIGDKTDDDVLFFGDFENPIPVARYLNPMQPAANYFFDANKLPCSESIIVSPQHDSADATEPRLLGSGNPRAFARGSESTDEAMTKTQQSNKKNKADNPLIVEEYSIYKERYQQAIALLDSKKYKDAEKAFNAAIKLNSTWPDAYCGLGQVCQKLAEKYNADIASVVSRLNLLKENAKKNKINIGKYTKEHEGYLKQQNEKYHEAVAYYEKALARSARCEQAFTALKKIGDVHEHYLAKENTLEIETVVPFMPKDQFNAPQKTIFAPSTKKDKKASAKQKINKQLPLSASDDKQDLPEQQNRNQYVLQKAQQEENAGNDLKAIECYKQSFTEGKSLASGYKCIFLYKKLRRYQDALKYATKLIAISEEEHSRVYDNQSIREEKPLDNYQYHHCYALYQRGKLHLKLKKIKEAVADFDAMLVSKEEVNFDISLIDIVISSYIKLGQYYCSLAYESPIISRIHYVNCMQQRYERVYNLIKLLGIVNHDRLSDIYLGFGDVERFKNNFHEAIAYYEKALGVINANIDSNFYSFDCIYQKLYQYSEHIGGHLVNTLSEAVLNKQSFTLSENDQYLFNLVHEVCVTSVIYSHISFQQSHIMLLKIAFIFGQYDDVISKIEHLLSGDFKQTKCSQRELFLFLGVCHEKQLDYDMATQWYVKAQKIRYDDDTDQRDKLMLFAQTACKRAAQSKKESVKKNKAVHASERKDVPGLVAPAQKNITIISSNGGHEGEGHEGIAKAAEQIKEQAFLCMVNGQIAQQDGRFNDAQTYYRKYLSFACNAARDTSTRINHIKVYDLFYEFAHIIINQDVMTQAVNKTLFSEDDVTSLFDFNYLDLLNDIYSEAVKYTSRAHVNLIFIAVLRRHYDVAIERIKIVIDRKIIDVRSSTRDLHYICGKMYELKADSVGAQAYYKVSGSSVSYPDDNESSPIVRAASTSQLQKIIRDELSGVLNSNLSLVETKEGTNPHRLFSEKKQILVADQNCEEIQHIRDIT